MAASSSAGSPPPTWRSLLETTAAPAGAPLALGIAVRQRTAYRADDWAPRRTETVTARMLATRTGELSLGIRPLVQSARSDAWVKTGVSWDAVRRPTGGFHPAHARWFTELGSILLGARAGGPWADPGEWLTLDTAESSLLWPHLRAAAGLGIPLVSTSAGQQVVLGDEAAAEIAVERDGDALRLHPRVTVDGVLLDHHAVRALGHVGVYAAELDRDPVPVLLAPLALPGPVHALLGHDEGLAVPVEDRDAFLAEGLPRLRRRATVTAARDIPVPPPADPVAVVTVAFAEDEVDYRIEWSYPGQPRWPYPPERHPDRDADAEAVLRNRLTNTWQRETDAEFAAAGHLTGVDVAEFAAQVLPAWAELDGVRIEGNAPRRTYTELTGNPRIRVTTVETPDADWFDLGILVSIDGRPIPFATLISALVRGRRKLLLSDGAYFALTHPALDRLKDLLEEAGEFAEWETAPRISRHQTDLWEEFEDLADESETALAWRELAAGLRDADGVPATPPPTGLVAHLRPYQQAGFDWLAFLWRHRLGGILADDMGLGKTVQLLALAAHVRETGADAPLLVIAPTSVVPTWAAEAARFTPGLRVQVARGTAAATGVRVSDLAAGADILITSYALLRLDRDEYVAHRWSAVILDEAQFVKNPRTRLHRAVADLQAGAVFAATGTPLENSLTDLWSLLALTAPGLFPSARRFRDEYVTPIEHGKVPENAEQGPYRAARLARLRRRIRPLMLRRTKDVVAADLPPRQELELRVALDPAHRALYDTVLQRERQKVLGLLDDLDRNRFIVFRSLTLLRLMSLAPVLVDPSQRRVPASKLDALLDRLVEVAAEGHRALVFSQFTSFLKLAAERLDAAGIAHAYLDGSTRNRGEVVEEFRTGTAPAFLISLKAGGFGLTLTEADYVFVLDPWWNPAAEAQAVDRAHRIGQTKSVMVYRMIAADTIEEKVVALQQRKARLFQAVVDDDALFSQDLSADDIRSLLDG